MTYSTKSIPIIIAALLFTVAACNNDLPDADDADAMALTSEDRYAIEALLDRYVEHAMKGDWEAYADLFHTEAIRMYAGPRLYEGRHEIRDHAEGLDFTFHHIDFSPIEVAGNRELAYIWWRARFETSSEEDGETVTRHGDTTMLAIVRQNEDESWRFFRVIYQWNDRSVVGPES